MTPYAAALLRLSRWLLLAGLALGSPGNLVARGTPLGAGCLILAARKDP